MQLREIVATTLAKRAAERGGYVDWDEMSALPMPDGSRLRLVDPGRGGIWNPSNMSATLSIVTSPDGPYADRELEGGLLKYSYQSGPQGGKNLKLRRAMDLGYPIIRFNKIAKGTYVPIYPVFVVGDDPINREFTLSVDESLRLLPNINAPTAVERRYAERLVLQRVHQPAFRARVMLAYESKGTVCVLKKAPLLDAAHITGDGETRGEAIVTNGLSLCKIHHAAYDQNLLGVSPEYRVVINKSLLKEIDGPMLLHGLQEMNNRLLSLPRSTAEYPDRDRLDLRFQEFLAG